MEKEIICKPIISIIAPFFNGEKYLKRFIESVLSQSFLDFELILVDDGSTDSSFEIINDFKDERIVYYKKQNGGVSSARNCGITIAKGHYICFFDADDTVLPNTLEVALSKIHQNDLIVFCYRDVLQNGTMINHFQKETLSSGKGVLRDIFFFSSEMQIYSPCNKLYLKSVIFNNNLRFEEGLKIGEDYLFNLSYFSVCGSIVFVNDVLYNYHQNNSSAINTLDQEMWKKQFRVVKETYKYKINNNSIYEKRFIIKRIAFLFNYYQSKNIKSNQIKKLMANFYDALNTLNIINTSKCGFLYDLPYKHLIKRRYKHLNLYMHLVERFIAFKHFLKGKKRM